MSGPRGLYFVENIYFWTFAQQKVLWFHPCLSVSLSLCLSVCPSVWLSVSPSVSPSVCSLFYLETTWYIFLICCLKVWINNSQKLKKLNCLERFSFYHVWIKSTKNGQGTGFFSFCKSFVISYYWKYLRLKVEISIRFKL